MNPSTLFAGIARTDITPPLGGDLQGYLRDRGSVGIFERLYCKALVLDNGSTTTVLLANDLIGISPKITRQVRADVVKKYPHIKPSAIMVSATHTHCGPTILEDVLTYLGADKKYLHDLKNKMVETVERAMNDRQPVTVGTGRGQAFFNINRRLMTPQGLMFAPNRKGVCDHELGVIRIDGPDGNPKVILMNFTCHPTTWGDLWISPDYPGFAAKMVEAKYKNKVVAMFTNGACGNIRPCLTKGKNPKTFGGGTREAVKQLGAELGREVLRVAGNIKTRSITDTAAVAKTIRLPLGRPFTIPQLQEEIRQAKAKVQEAIDQKKGPVMVIYEQAGLNWAKQTLAIMKNKKFKPWVEGEIQLLRIGGNTLVGLPGEILCEIGLAIKQKLGAGRTFIVGYANGCVGYIPTAKALKEGGYEADASIKGFSLPAKFSPRVETVIVNTASALHKAMAK